MGHIYTLLIAVCGWVLFQLNSVGQAFDYYRAMFFGGAGLFAPEDLFNLGAFGLILSIAVFASMPLGKKLFSRLPEKLRSVAAPVLVVLVLVLSTAYLVDATYNPFLYFRF